jgi:hypothetical protein
MDSHPEGNEREKESYNLFNIESSCDCDGPPAYADSRSLPVPLSAVYCLGDNGHMASYREHGTDEVESLPIISKSRIKSDYSFLL